MSPSALESDEARTAASAPVAAQDSSSSTPQSNGANGTAAAANGTAAANTTTPVANGTRATNGNGTVPIMSNGATSTPTTTTGPDGSTPAAAEAAAAAGSDNETKQPPKFDPVAVIGMSCRLPGGVSDPEDFYELICRARSGWRDMPEDRFSRDGYWHPNPDKLGCYNPSGGCFLTHDVAVFDAPFFNITEREAVSMDPQHRLLLECAYEALENAGLPRHKLAGQNVGVYAGGSFTDYELNNLRDLDTAPMYQSTGNAPSLMSNRVSYYFDFRGPSHTVETACSSSLTALHLAMQSLQSGDSSVVLLVSSHLNLLPDHFVSMSSQGLLSPDGRSYAFDSRGNGFGRGEGAGVVVLKPLAKALQDNDNIRSVIVGTGVNQDGRTNGITMPSGEAQLDLMRRVYREANIDPKLTGYVEAHGTGTKVGDPLEMKALHEMFWEGRTKRTPLYVGSVKTNVGHLEGASGIVSLIKSTLMLERGYLLPNHDFQKGNPEIPFDEWGVKVPPRVMPWPRGKKYISINSFGFGGGNAHAVLEAAPRQLRNPESWAERAEPKRLFVTSAYSKESLSDQMRNVTVYLERNPFAFQQGVLANLAYTLGQRRSFLPYKFAAVANDGEMVTTAFSTAVAKPVRSTREPVVGFVFTGQGAQWHAMGRELIEAYPVFKRSVERFDDAIGRLGASFSMMEELHRDAKTSRLSDADLSQPGCTAIQLALTDLLADWGVRPRAVVGHSSGEICAAYAAGVLTHEECASIAYFRGQSVLELKKDHPGLEGGMLAVGAGPDDVWPMIKTLKAEGKVTVACVNSPGSITASGDVDAVEELARQVEEKQLFNRRVRVDTAYHSHHMELVAEWYGNKVGQTNPQSQTDVEFFSSLRGRLIDHKELDTSYWVQNLTHPVLFSQAVADMCTPRDGKDNIDILVELGPHAALEGPVKQILKDIPGLTKKPLTMGALSRNKDAVDTALALAGNLFCQGTLIKFEAINFPVPTAKPVRALRDFPTYAWNHGQRFWWESRIAGSHVHRPFPRNDVVGVLADYSNELEPTWRSIIRPDEMPWVRGHNFQDMIIYPMAGYLSMAVEAVAQRASLASQNFDRFVFKDVSISRPLVVQEAQDSEINITLRPFTEGTRHSSKAWDEFRVFSWNKDRKWLEHCRGLLRVEMSTDTNPVHDMAKYDDASFDARKAQVLRACTDKVDADDIYRELDGVTAKYNAQFKSMENCTASDTSCVADIIVPDTAKGMPKGYEPSVHIHPAFLDQFTHAAWVILGAGRGRLPAIYMPKFVKSLTISANVARTPGDRLRVYGMGNPDFSNPGSTKITMFATTMDGKSEQIHMEDLTVDPFLDGAVVDKAGPRELCYKMGWEPLLAPEETKDGDEEKSDPPAAPEFAQDMTIICTQSQEGDLVAALKEKLGAATKGNVRVGQLGNVDTDGRVCVVVSELDRPILATLGEADFGHIQKLSMSAKGILWVVKGAYTAATNPHLGMAVGLARTVRSESGLKFATLDLDGVKELPTTANTVQTIFDVAHNVFGTTADLAPEMEFQEREGILSVPRVTDDFEINKFVEESTNENADPFLQPWSQPGRPLRINVGTKGALDTLHFVDDTTAGTPLAPDQISIEVKVTSMNFKDIMISMGEVPSPYLGVECAGIVDRVGSEVTHLQVGDRVCASSEGAYSTYARCKATSAARIPDDMSLETGATVPVVFATAYYSLFDIGRLLEGETVLIHAAAGGVGQAAIMLCQMAGAEVFATVGSTAKKTFLMDTYGVPEDHIFFSRDVSFAKGVRHATAGRGVDLVLNSLAGDSLRATWECMAHFGRFVEIGKRDILANSGLQMAVFEHNATFSSVDLTVVAAERPKVMKRVLDDVFDLLRKGVVRPISPITTFPISNVEAAFRTLQAGKAHGKILVTASPDDKVKATYSAKVFDNILSGDATYLIVGGTGGIGRSMTKWMVRKGAKHILLVSRSDKVSDKVAEVIADAKEHGATVGVRKCNILDSEDVARLVKEVSAEMPAIRGLVHSAMILDDVLFENMQFPQWQTVVESKVSGGWNLHAALQAANCPLDFFIVLSSVAGIIGNQGQAAYSAANTFLDSLVQHRRRLGLPATTLDLAAVSDTGYLADNEERRDVVLDQIGGEAISEKEILALLAASMTGKAGAGDEASSSSSPCPEQIITGLKLPATYANLFWASDPKFRPLCERAASEFATGDAGGAAGVSPGAALRRATSYEEAHAVVLEALLDKTASVLMIPREEFDPTKDTVFYGLDSLVSIEIRNWITREFGAALQILDMLSSGSFVAIADIVLRKTEMVSFEKK